MYRIQGHRTEQSTHCALLGFERHFLLCETIHSIIFDTSRKLLEIKMRQFYLNSQKQEEVYEIDNAK